MVVRREIKAYDNEIIIKAQGCGARSSQWGGVRQPTNNMYIEGQNVFLAHTYVPVGVPLGIRGAPQRISEPVDDHPPGSRRRGSGAAAIGEFRQCGLGQWEFQQ